MIIPQPDLQEIDRLQELNLNLQAYEAAKPYGEMTGWEGTRALLTASHLAFGLGAPDLSYRLNMRAWHRDKHDPEAIFYYAIETMQRRGPLHALMFTRRYPHYHADEKLTSWWYSLMGQLHAGMRDFATAEAWHERAAKVCPGEPWVWVAKAFTLEQQDRYDEALECARQGLELNRRKRSTVATVSHFLSLLERDAEAIDLLERTTAEVENAWLQKDLADLQSELGMHEQAHASLERCFGLLPLMEPKVAEWLYGSLSDTSHLLGDRDKAIEYAGKASSHFHTKTAEILGKAEPGAKRVTLEVGFLRQHHVTCAPATLTNIARFWGKRAEHLEVVEQICYDGTPSYKERSWAEANGWHTREFTLNWENATALLDRGVPLTLATVHPGGGHLQAIIGYDAGRGTYLLRDPYHRRTGEILADGLIEQQRSSGPRVMALVPEERAELLNGLELSESDIYDLVYEVERSLDAHDRETAGAAMARLAGEHPGHRLTHVAEWSVGNYDTNNLGVRAAMRKLLELYPEDVNLRLNDVGISAPYTGRVERLAKLEKYSLAKESDPLIWQAFGYELGADAAQHSRALHWLYRSARRSPGNALTFKLIADILWAQRRFAEASDLYRIASSLNDKDEQLAYSFFLAMRHLGRGDEALAVLGERVRRLGRQSSDPVRSLFAALRETGRVEEGFAELSSAMERRPEDGELMLFAADMYARYGRPDDAANLLARAERRAPKARWLRSAASVAQVGGKLDEALRLWRETTAADPAALDAHENIAFLVKGLEGANAAKEHLRRVCRKFPTHRNLQALRLQHLREEPAEAIAVLRDMLRLDPHDIWAWREQSHWYAQVGRLDRALEAADRALAVDPNDATSRYFRGRALELLKRRDEAAGEYRKAVELDIDQTYAIAGLLGTASNLAAKREALGFVWGELGKQFSRGDGLSAYREESRGVLDRTVLLLNLREHAEKNPASCPAISAVTLQLADMGRFDEALVSAREATERFPLLYQVWHDLSVIHKMRGDIEAEMEALRTAISISPGWSYGVQQLADALQRAGRFAEEHDVLAEALTRLPFDNFLLGYLADAYWHLGERSKAIETAKRAVTLEPDYQWAWAAIKRWADEAGEKKMPAELARELTERKPKDIRAWITLAEMLDDGVYSEERIGVIEQALRIDPHSSQVLAMKALALADARRFEDALEVARTRMPDGHRPEQLRFVESGIEMMRGRMIDCVNVLTELTESSPGYIPAWSRLADIYRTSPDHRHECRKAALELVRLMPREAVSYGYLGEACLNLEMREEARDAFQQAVALEPSYDFAVRSLFTLLADDEDWMAASKLAESVAEASLATGLPVKAELAVRRQDRAGALAAIREMLAARDIAQERIDPVFEKAAGLFGSKDRSILELLETSVRQPGVSPLAGRHLIDAAWRLDGRKKVPGRLDSLSRDAKLWAAGAAKYMELLAAERPKDIAKFIDENAGRLRSETVTFGQVAYQLSVLGDLPRADQWFAGWEGRDDVQPWMLWNLAVMRWRGGDPSGAERVSRAALGLPYDETTNLHLTMLGLAALKRGDTDEALRLQASVNSAALEGWDRYLCDLLSEAVWALGVIGDGDIEGAKAIVESIVTQIVQMDRKATDRITRELLHPVVSELLGRISDRWFTFKTRAKLWYWQLG